MRFFRIKPLYTVVQKLYCGAEIQGCSVYRIDVWRKYRWTVSKHSFVIFLPQKDSNFAHIETHISTVSTLVSKTSFHIKWYFSLQDTNLFMLLSWHWTKRKDPPLQQPIGSPPVCNGWRAGYQRFLCDNPRILDSSLSKVLALVIAIDLAFRMPDIREWASNTQHFLTDSTLESWEE
jgi:hypothetical protein